ncbi:MAG: YjbH domain-containing protein [Ignavibacteria bacterium]|nr:YjbH domain-containing protein [Ignavibacteria bacterium]
MRTRLAVVFVVAIFTSLAIGQGTSGTDAKYEYRNLIDLPTAGILEKGNVGITTDIMPAGVLVSKIEVGVFENFSFGISYGGNNIIGRGKMTGYKLPGINVRARIFNETEALPAILVGFDSQGKGEFDKKLNRFQIKSPGLFAAVSKNFDFYGYFSLHGLLNYSFERDDSDKDLNIGLGFEKTFSSKVSLIGEYDFAINDNNSNAFGDGTGYLNLGIRWSLGEGLTLGLNLRDLLDNKKFTSSNADRGLFVEYIKAIF